MTTTDTIFIEKLLASIAEYKASDLHLSVGNPPTLRIDGILSPLNSENVVTGDLVNAFCKIVLDEKQQQHLEEHREIVVSWVWEGKARYKVHLFYQDNFLSASIRFIPERIPSLSELSLPDDFQNIMEIPNGLVLFNGPSGSGKTTSVASIIDTINQNQPRRILTIEEPIEYYFTDAQSIIDQREIGRDVPSYQEGMESFIREDIDIFYVSKIKDYSVLQELLRLSMAGHLVFSIVDTSSTVSALESLVSMAPTLAQAQIRAQLADNLKVVLTQKLVPKLGGGRIPVVETLFSTSAIRSIIRDGELYQMHNILQTSRGEGCISFDRALAGHVKRGIISEDAAFAHAFDKNNFRSMLS